MAITRRKKASNLPKQGKVVQLNVVEGILYKTKSIADTHRAWAKDELVESFTLPTAAESKVKSKYGALKAEVNGRVFDSIMEAKFYVYLLHLRHDGEIQSFDCQVKYELQPKYRSKHTGKIVRPIHYLADFVITKNDGSVTAVDVKGQETDVFKLKQKMFEYKYPDIEFYCVQWRASSNEWMTLDEIKEIRKENKKARKSS